LAGFESSISSENNTMDLHLSDKHILIAGGSKGMGLAWGAR
jgi:hypothetical protein